MRKFLKFIVLVNVLIIISTLGAFYYVNSDSFGHLVQGRISEELGNPVSFDRLKIHSNGDVTIKGLKVLALDQTTLLTIARVEVELKFSDLLSSDYLPQEIRVFDVDLDLKVKNNNWPLAILNKEKKLPPSPNFYAKVETLNLHLTKQNAELKAYAVKLDLLSAAVEKVPVISSLSTKGVVSERQLKFNSVKFGIFSGVVESVVSVLLTEKQAVKEAVVDVDLKEIDLSEVAQFAKLAPFQVLGNLEGDAKIGFNSKKLTVDADLTTGALSMTGTGVEKVLSLLKKGEKTLSFKSAHVKLKGSNEAVLFTKLELINNEFISLYAPMTKIAFDEKFKPRHVNLPLRLTAPYDVIKWRDFTMKGNPDYIEIPFDLECDLKDLKTELINALLYTIQKNSLKKSIKRLEDKLGFKVDDQVVDVKKIIDSDGYKDIKQAVKKEVDRIDRKQVDEIIDAFEKDDKKKDKIKKNIDLFMQFLK